MEIESALTKCVSISEVEKITLTGLGIEQIEKAKRTKIQKHIKKVMANLKYTSNDETRKMCESRIFFVKQGDQLVLCGLYKVSEKFDKIEPYRKYYSQICDYLLYSKSAGFFYVYGCSSPLSVNQHNTSPAIYYQSTETGQYKALEYGSTFDDINLLNLQIKYNVRTYYPNEKKTYHIVAFINTRVAFEIKKATTYCELPLVPNWFVYTNVADNIHWKIPARLINYVEKKQYPLLHLDYSLNFGYNASLPLVLLSRDIKRFRIADNKNYYFYISKSNTPAFDIAMRCASKVGKICKMDNLLKFDSSVNYQLTIPRTTSPNMVSFIFGVVTKSKTISPSILGCSIYEIIQILCSENDERSSIIGSELNYSLNNAINLICMNYNNLSKSEIVNLIKTCYGSCAIATPIYWPYYHGEGLRCDSFPTSIGSSLGIRMNELFASSLDDVKFPVKWTSEYSLLCIVLQYYSDAEMHYSAQWLGQQHLDIYIPSLQLGIEYQGQQHYEPSSFFGGESGFKARKMLDERKRQLCRNHGVILIEWSYKTQINAANLITAILQNCNVQIPVPNPFRNPPTIVNNESEGK